MTRITSMTAFARAESATEWGTMAWEVRSVNHRYLEVSLRLPEELRALESSFRETIGARLSRGRIDATLKLRGDQQLPTDAQLSMATASRLIELANQVRAIDSQVGALRCIDVLGWPGVVASPEPDQDALRQASGGLLSDSLDDLVADRYREGGKLKALMVARLDAINTTVTQVRAMLPEIGDNWRSRLEDRLADAGQEFEPGRLEQELVIFLHKADISEEIDRLETHCVEVRKVLDTGGAVGRRLDFLMQELNREANTLGSKANDVRLSQASVELKVLIEQIREQVQNIE